MRMPDKLSLYLVSSKNLNASEILFLSIILYSNFVLYQRVQTEYRNFLVKVTTFKEENLVFTLKNNCYSHQKGSQISTLTILIFEGAS